MIFTFIIVLFSLILLMVLHELGHFLLAKKFGVKVPEFGIGYPPRIWGKKIGQTIYSINWLPFGAFVKIIGEDGESKEEGSFALKPIWQRALILFGGVAMFWIVAFLIFCFVVSTSGVPTAINDDYVSHKINGQASVIIIKVAEDSPAKKAGLKIGDTIIDINDSKKITKIADLQNTIKNNLEKQIKISILRDGKRVNVFLVPRKNPPEGQGAIGIAPLRIANIKTEWYKAPIEAGKITFEQTKMIPEVLFTALKKKIHGEEVVGIQISGPIGVVKIMGDSLKQGIGNFFVLIARIAIWLALFNILPIPALDGGRLLFLAIEAIRRKPAPQRLEHYLNLSFFGILICLMIAVTIKDIINIF